MEEKVPNSLPDAIGVLQTPSSSSEDRFNALRFLYIYVEETSSIDSSTRMKINQLLLDNILELVVNDERTADLRKRQLIRTECFLMLAKVLETKSLFGGVDPELSLMSSKNRMLQNTRSSSVDIKSHTTSSEPVDVYLGNKQTRKTDGGNMMEKQSSEPLVDCPKSIHSSISKTTTLTHSSSTSLIVKEGVTASKSMLSRTTDDTSHTSSSHDYLLANGIIKKANNRRKYLKPRQSVLSSSLEADRFAPKDIDPHNMYEVDNRLGYQKSRIWFPTQVKSESKLLPNQRKKILKGQYMDDSDQVVQDYLQMKALLSYVGDLVMHTPVSRKDRESNSVGVAKGELPVDPQRYKDALKEAVVLWTPLVGVNLPKWVQQGRKPSSDAYNMHRRKLLDMSDKVISADKLGKEDKTASKTDISISVYGKNIEQPLHANHESKKGGGHSLKTAEGNGAVPDTEDESKAVLLTKNSLRKILREEKNSSNATKASYRRMIQILSKDDSQIGLQSKSRNDEVQSIQKKITLSLEDEKSATEASIDAISLLMDQTIKLQYASFPSRYLMVVDGGKSSTRLVFKRAISTMMRVRRRNDLMLAMGVWKIVLVEAYSKSLRPKYAKFASVHLISGWLQARKIKQIKQWLTCWKDVTARGIFMERNKSVLMIQCLYRWWRDRRKFLDLHYAGPYNGPLSDIYLGPFRKKNVFFIPQVIRSTRRMLWQAAILIQTQYRRYMVQRDYIAQVRKAILIQSMLRMYPKRVQYLRLRATAIKVSAWVRRTLKRKWYIRLKRATIIVQKYVRRYLYILLKWRLFLKKWNRMEEYLAAAIKIQCRWRIIRAKRKVDKRRHNIKRREWAALLMQRNWYRVRGSFHTFLLMCCYRMREVEDEELEALSVRMGKYYCARRIQRQFHQYYVHRVESGAIKLQCWYRGLLGKKFTSFRRRIKWAARKLHHWARGMMKYKHKCVRKIQRVWWQMKKGRLLRHLDFVAKRFDQQDDKARKSKQRFAAISIQALVHGIWTRRWVRNHRAALKIQKPARFFIARKRWKREYLERSIARIRKIVGSYIGRGLTNATRTIVKLHNAIVKRIQAVVRGLLIRSRMKKVRLQARKQGISIITIQRWWRKSGAFMQAVQEVMALRRLDTNPFRKCAHVHQILIDMQKPLMKYLHFGDPRAGLLTSMLFYRLGLSDLNKIFPVKNYKYASDLRGLTLTKMIDLFNKYQQKESSKNDRNGVTSDGRYVTVPKTDFQTIINIFSISSSKHFYLPRTKEDKESLSMLYPVQEIFSQNEFVTYATNLFIQRFGQGFLQRAENFANSLREMGWNNYNNFKGIGQVLTKGQIVKAIATAKVPGDVKSLIESYTTSNDQVLLKAEAAWDESRLIACSETLQAAVEMCLIKCPEGFIRDKLSMAAILVTNFKRKFMFIMEKAKTNKKKKAKEAAAAERAKKAAGVNGKSSNKNEVAINEKVIIDNKTRKATLEESLEREFTGNETDISKEINMGVCKIYMPLLLDIFKISNAIQSLKNTWHNRAMARAVRKHQIKVFLETATADYKKDRETNYVEIVWKKLRHRKMIEDKMESIRAARKYRIELMNYELSCIPRFGFTANLDANGYTMWIHDTDWSVPSSYEMPLYTEEEWMAVSKIQYVYRPHLARVLEARRLKEEARRKEVEHQEKLMQAAYNQTQRNISVKLNINRKNIKNIVYPENNKKVTHELDSLLPYRLRFVVEPEFRKLDWILYVKDDGKSKVYLSAIILHLKVAKQKMDIRLINGETLKNVDYSKITVTNFDSGTKVEARYKGGTTFFRGVIVAVHETGFGEKSFGVRYDDGEIEAKLPYSFVRISPEGFEEFLLERTKLLNFHYLREKRLSYINSFKEERIARLHLKAQQIMIKFNQNWNSALVHSDANAPGHSIMSMIQTSDSLRSIQYDISCQVYYTKGALRFGWHEKKSIKKGTEEVSYVNYSTYESVRLPPVYSSEEHVYCRQIQGVWLAYQARKRMLRLLLRDSIISIVNGTIQRYQTEAYIGYGMEGLTPILLLRRAGLLEVADSFAAFHKNKPKLLRDLSIDDLVKLPIEKFETIGISKHSDVKSLQKFQDWYNKTPLDQRTSQLSLINYYTGLYDNRTILNCIQQSESMLLQRINKSFRNSLSRAQAIAKEMTTSTFPLAKMQLESFLNVYNGKPGIALDNIKELLHQPTVHTYLQEKEAYVILKGSSRRLSTQLLHRKMKLLRKHVMSAERRAEEVLAGGTQEYTMDPQKRPLITGPEARAALILRVDVMEYLKRCEEISPLIQKRIRGITKRLWYLRVSRSRKNAATNIQRSFRGWHDRILANKYRLQQTAEWEQLWDDRRRVLYYYNKITQTASYDEPDAPIRPLVRDLRSSALIQAWPHLDATDDMLKNQGRKLAICSVCNDRPTVRICYDCVPVGHVAKLSKATSYCFSCFASYHSNDPDRMNHNFREVRDNEVELLRCVECNELATRKCMGILDEKDIDDLCSRLQRTMAQNWNKVLSGANIGGEKKLSLLVDQIKSNGDDNSFLTPSQLQSIRTMLEQTRAECDDCYCDNCYKDVHSGGKRISHKWIGFAPGAEVCSVCVRSPAQKMCNDCNGSIYCNSCFKVFHSKGRKRKHTFSVMQEEIPNGYEPCSVCHRRPATINCPKCSLPNCNSCFECIHQKTHDNDPKSSIDLISTSKGNALAAMLVCTQCGEAADQKCVQCNDYYCSRTWMGNPGCFISFHSKGNRAFHLNVPIDILSNQSASQLGRLESKSYSSLKVKSPSKGISSSLLASSNR